MDELDFSISDDNPLNQFIHNKPQLIPQFLSQIKSLSLQQQEYILLSCDLFEAIVLCPDQVPALLSALKQCPHSAMAFKKVNDALIFASKNNPALVHCLMQQLLKYSQYEQHNTIIDLHQCNKDAIKPILENLGLFPSHVQQQTLLQRDQQQYSTLMKVIITAPKAVESYLKLIYPSPIFESIMTYKKPDLEQPKELTALNIAKKYFLDLKDEMAYSILLAYHHLAFHHLLKEQYVHMVLNLPNSAYAQLKKDYVLTFLFQQIEKIGDDLVRQNLTDCFNEYKHTGDYATLISNYYNQLQQIPIKSNQQFLFFKSYSHQDKQIINLLSFIENHTNLDDHQLVRLIKPRQ